MSNQTCPHCAHEALDLEIAKSLNLPGRFVPMQETPSLRDYFASAALTGILASGHPHKGEHAVDIVNLAHLYADRMLSERSKQT